MSPGWKLALRNLSRNRRRNVVTGLAIALGYAGVLLLGGYAVRMERMMRTASVYLQRFGHVSIYAPGGLAKAAAKPADYALSREAQDEILGALRADPRVELVGRYLQGIGLVGNGCETFPFVALGVDLDVERRLRSHPEVLANVPEIAGPAAGRAIADAQDEEAPIAVAKGLGGPRLRKPPSAGPLPRSAVVPAALDCDAPDVATRIGADPYVQLALRTYDGSFAATDATIVGYFDAPTTEADRCGVVAGLDLVQRLYDTDRVTYVAAFLRDERQAGAVARDLEARLASRGVKASVYRYDDPVANPYYVGTTGLIRALLSFIGALVAAVVTMSVLNAATLAILERTREMGTLRSIGFTRRQIVGMFLRETVLLCAVGVGGGLVLGFAAAGAVAAARIRFEPPGMGGSILLGVVPSPGVCIGAAVLFLGLTLGATWIAVRRKVRERVAALVVEVTA